MITIDDEPEEVPPWSAAKEHIRVGVTNEEGEFCEVMRMALRSFREHLRTGQLTDVDLGYLALDHLGLLSA